jgi:hypothetical protein
MSLVVARKIQELSANFGVSCEHELVTFLAKMVHIAPAEFVTTKPVWLSSLSAAIHKVITTPERK